MNHSVEKKKEKEKKVVGLMMDLYAAKHSDIDIQRLKEYAFLRIEHCPLIESKTFCSVCKVHCYEKQRRAEIKKVMRYAGARMLFHHPIMAIAHLIEEQKQKKRGG